MRQPLSESPAQGPATPPFKFLNYFEEADHASFAGREDDVQEALAGLMRGRTFVLYGRSGLGKTSLLLAGLFPRLRERGFHPLRVRLLDSPVEDFRAALAAEFQRPELARERGPGERRACLPRIVEELSAREPLVIVLDQFEEFFVRFRDRPAERSELVAQLGCIHREHAANIRFVFSLREDYYAELEDLRAELPELTRYGLRLLPLTAYGARQAIVRPLQHACVTYEEAFVNRLVDLLADWNFEPPVLQIVCTELYRDVVARRGLPVHLTREELDARGGVDGIFRGYVHRVTSGLEAERLLLVRVVLDALISSEQTRYALRAEDLLAGSVRAKYEEVRSVLDHLTEQGLLRVEHRKGERWYELLHEHLMSIVDSWLATDVDYVRFRTTRDLVATLSEDPRWRTHPDWLLTARQLQERVDPWKEQLQLDEDQTEFLLRSSIHGQAHSVAYWASRFDELGAGRSVGLVLGLLDTPDVALRRGAAASCGQLKDASGRLATRSLELALTDPDEEVRRAARRSFVQLAGREELARLRDALATPAHRALALELLAELLEAGRPLEGVPEHWRRQAEALVRARRLERERSTIRARTSTGAQMGALTGLAWSVTLGLLAGAYWVCTVYPEEVTRFWPGAFLRQLLWLAIDNIVFVFVPWGLILGWRVARRAANTAAAQGREDWRSSVLHSGTLVISCVLLHLVVLITFPAILDEEAALARDWGVSRIAVFVAVALLTSLATWLLTVGLVLLGRRCITSRSRPVSVYVFAALCATALPYALGSFLCMVAWWADVRPGSLHQVLVTLQAGAAFMANFQVFIILSVLAAERSRLAPASRRGTLWARGFILLGSVVFLRVFFSIHEPRTLPGLGRLLPFAPEVSVTGRVWQHEKDNEFFSLGAPPGGPFALSIDEVGSSRTRLAIGGEEVSRGMLLVSASPRLLGVVASLPGLDKPAGTRNPPLREDYHYVLRAEPIDEGAPGTLDLDRWTLAALPLEQVEGRAGAGPRWQVVLQGRLAPEQLGRVQGVRLQPVLVNIAGLVPGTCLGIASSSHAANVDSFVLTNRAATGSVLPPNIPTELFTEGLRLAPDGEGRWDTTLTLTPLVEFRPRACEPPSGGPLPGSLWASSVPAQYGEPPSLLVAITLY